MNHWRFPHNNSAPWDKKAPHNRDTLLSKKLWYQNNSKTQNGSPTMIFGDVRKKNRKNRDTLLSKKNSIPEQFWNTEGFAHDDFRRFETKKSTKLWHLILQNFSIPEHFWDTRDPYEMFRYCETRKINKIVIPLLSKIILIPERFWSTEGFAHDVCLRFGTKNFRRNNVTPPFYP